MNQLSLRIKKKYLDEIKAGTKTSEFRACNDFYADRLGIIENDYVVATKQYDTIKLYTGEKTDCEYAILKVKGIYINVYENEIPEGLKKGDMLYEIELGEIIEQN